MTKASSQLTAPMQQPLSLQLKMKASSSTRKRLAKWMGSYEAVAGCVARHGDLEQLLLQGGGIARLPDFAPDWVAAGILELLEGLEDQEWNTTRASDDPQQNNIAHTFLSTKSAVLEGVFRMLSLLLPDSLWTFSGAKYCCQGHIKPHDDRAYTQVRMEDGSIQLCSRNIAVIFYLTKDWTAADGGSLIDHEAPEGPQTYTPQFNSVIAFTIPRWHEVTPVTSHRPRYSIFGWFLEPSKLYELQLDTAAAPQQQRQQQAGGQAATAQQQRRQKHKQKQRRQSEAAGGVGVPPDVQPDVQPPQQKHVEQPAAAGNKQTKKKRNKAKALEREAPAVVGGKQPEQPQEQLQELQKPHKQKRTQQLGVGKQQLKKYSKGRE